MFVRQVKYITTHQQLVWQEWFLQTGNIPSISRTPIQVPSFQLSYLSCGLRGWPISAISGKFCEKMRRGGTPQWRGQPLLDAQLPLTYFVFGAAILSCGHWFQLFFTDVEGPPTEMSTSERIYCNFAWCIWKFIEFCPL